MLEIVGQLELVQWTEFFPFFVMLSSGIINVVKENNEQDSEIFNEETLDEYFDLAELDSCYEHFGDANHEGMAMPSHVMATATSSTGEVSTVGYSYTTSMGHSVSHSFLLN